MLLETVCLKGDEVAGVLVTIALGRLGSRGDLSGDLNGLESAEEEIILRRFGAGVDIVALLRIELCSEP